MRFVLLSHDGSFNSGSEAECIGAAATDSNERGLAPGDQLLGCECNLQDLDVKALSDRIMGAALLCNARCLSVSLGAFTK